MMHSMSEFDASGFEDSYGTVTAQFYDAAYATLENVGRDAEFYVSLARESAGPVLELGCGTGRVLLEVATAGFETTGLDASEQMLGALRRKLAGAELVRPPRLVAARMQDFDLPGERFAMVYSAFRAFQHLYTVDDQLGCLACVRRHLEPGGLFAFDVFNPRLDRIAVDEPEKEEMHFEHEGDEVVRFTSVVRDRARQVQRVRMRYERRRGGQVVGNELATFHMRWFYRYELEHLMVRAGFEDVEIYGAFDRSPVGTETPVFVVVGRQP